MKQRPVSGTPERNQAAERPACPLELTEILAAIRRHEARRAAQCDPEASKRQAAAEISAFLGTKGTARVLEDVSADCGNLLATVQPVLSLFIGRRAASRLATRVVEASFVRI